MARPRPATDPTPPAPTGPHHSHQWTVSDTSPLCVRCGAYQHMVAALAPCPGKRPGHGGEPALAPAVPRHGRLVPAPDTPLSACPTNLDLSTPEGKRLAFNAASASDSDVPVGGRASIRARYYLVHPAEAPDPTTGEISHFARTVLIGMDGRTLSSCSDVLPHQLARALGLFTPEDWLAGIEFEIVSRPRKRGPGNYHDLRCVTVPGGDDDA